METALWELYPAGLCPTAAIREVVAPPTKNMPLEGHAFSSALLLRVARGLFFVLTILVILRTGLSILLWRTIVTQIGEHGLELQQRVNC